MMFTNFSKRQFLTLAVFCAVDFCSTLCVSLQSPFFPLEAEKKNVSATEYGLVFGIFELVVFIACPIFGRNLKKIGPKLLFNIGTLTAAVCVILFGFLDKVEGRFWFTSLSLLIRIGEALGTAAFITPSLAITAAEFPESVATTFATLETCFGLGFIVGPAIGGALYQVGGFTTPFASLGAVLLLIGVLTCVVLPTQRDGEVNPLHKGGLLRTLAIPAILIASSVTTMTAITNGFLAATLEPHLRFFELSPLSLGLMFIINGGMYAITTPLWGWACDVCLPPKLAMVLGCIFQICAICFIGPAPFIPMGRYLWSTILGLVLQGLGSGACFISSFVEALRTAEAYGYPNGIDTYGLISGLWASSFALGGFIGPTIAGVLYDVYGFQQASLLIIVVIIIVGLVALLFLIFSRPRGMYTELKGGEEDFLTPSRNGYLPLRGSDKEDLKSSSVAIGFERLPRELPGWKRRASLSSSASYSSSDHHHC